MKLLDQVRHCLRVKRYAYRTEQSYVRWICQYIHFHKQADDFRHPATLGAAEVEQFLTHLAVKRHVVGGKSEMLIVSNRVHSCQAACGDVANTSLGLFFGRTPVSGGMMESRPESLRNTLL